MKNKIFAVLVVVMLCLAVASCEKPREPMDSFKDGVKSFGSYLEKEGEEAKNEAKQNQEAFEKELEDNKVALDAVLNEEESRIELKSYSIVERTMYGYDGTVFVMYLNFDYTNTDDEDERFDRSELAFYQDGIRLTPWEMDYNPSLDTMIQPGVTIPLTVVWTLNNDTSDVVIRYGDPGDYDDDEIWSETTIKIK